MLLSKDFLELVWQHGMFSAGVVLRTVGGEQIEVLSPGFRSDSLGVPEFSYASIRFVESGVTLHGSIKIDSCSGDWRGEGTVLDEAFDNVILHFVGRCDMQVMQGDRMVSTLVADIPDYLADRALHLDDECRSEFYSMEDVYRENLVSRLTAERLARKSREVLDVCNTVSGDWNHTAMITLFRSLGFRNTKLVYEALGRAIPYYVIRDKACKLEELEALLLSTAGYLQSTNLADEYMWKLRDIYHLQRERYTLSEQVVLPDKIKMRPASYPQLQLARVAAILHNELSLFDRLISVDSYSELRDMFRAQLSPYWQNHYSLGQECERGFTTITDDRIDLFIINFVVPFLHAYGQYNGDEDVKERALSFLSSTAYERNKYTRAWIINGYTPANAFYSQGLIQLSSEYCDAGGSRCVVCPFGAHYLLGFYKKYKRAVVGSRAL